MLNWFTSEPSKREEYKDVFKSNENFDIEEDFKNILERAGHTVTIRRTLGSDINASCGQLRREKMKEDNT